MSVNLRLKKYLQISEAHIEASKTNSFTHKKALTRDGLREGLMNGETFESLWLSAKERTTIHSQLMGSVFNHVSKTMTADVNRFFRSVCKQLDIN